VRRRRLVGVIGVIPVDGVHGLDDRGRGFVLHRRRSSERRGNPTDHRVHRG